MLKDARTLSILALVPYPVNTVPGQRYRIEQWQPYLAQNGMTIEFRPSVDSDTMKLLYQPGRVAAKAARLAASFIHRMVDVSNCSRYDAILIHRTACLIGPALLERVVSLLRKPIIFDFDDAIYLLDTSEANRRIGFLKCPAKTGAICRISSCVIVGNSYLAKYASQYNNRVTVIPSSIDLESYRPVNKKGSRQWNGRIVVGWMGSSTSQKYLEDLHPVLRQLTSQHDIELRIVSDRKPILPGIPFVWRVWSAATEVDELSRFDIGIMPMLDSPWSRGKCGMKALQYMGMAIPAVCDAVGANCEIIRHGQNGFLASGAEEWLFYLEQLIHDAFLRERLGMAGRRTVEEHYSASQCASRFAEAIQETLLQ